MSDVAQLADRLRVMGWDAGDSCVFFHFAWEGDLRLTDGNLETQLSNAVHSANAVQSAKEAGCIKFINAGTLEETFAECFVEGQHPEYQSQQSNYAVAKLASRDLCKLVAYINKIDYVHTRLSAPLDSSLAQVSYIASTLRAIIAGEPFATPTNKNPVDITSVEDVAYAYFLLGERGRNKADYFVGCASPVLLTELFTQFDAAINRANPFRLNSSISELGFFSSGLLRADTGYSPPCFPFEKLLEWAVKP